MGSILPAIHSLHHVFGAQIQGSEAAISDRLGNADAASAGVRAMSPFGTTAPPGTRQSTIITAIAV